MPTVNVYTLDDGFVLGGTFSYPEELINAIATVWAIDNDTARSITNLWESNLQARLPEFCYRLKVSIVWDPRDTIFAECIERYRLV